MLGTLLAQSGRICLAHLERAEPALQGVRAMKLLRDIEFTFNICRLKKDSRSRLEGMGSSVSVSSQLMTTSLSNFLHFYFPVILF